MYYEIDEYRGPWGPGRVRVKSTHRTNEISLVSTTRRGKPAGGGEARRKPLETAEELPRSHKIDPQHTSRAHSRKVTRYSA